MNTFLLTWNPTKWYWKDYKDATIITRNGEVYSDYNLDGQVLLNHIL